MADPADEEKPQFDENSSERIRQLLLSYIQKVGQLYQYDESVQEAINHLSQKFSKPFQ
jgi:hypothetical protein